MLKKHHYECVGGAGTTCMLAVAIRTVVLRNFEEQQSLSILVELGLSYVYALFM